MRSHKIAIYLHIFCKLQGFKDMVNSGTKLIFILLPGVKEFLKQYSKTKNNYALVKRALDVSSNLQFNISIAVVAIGMCKVCKCTRPLLYRAPQPKLSRVRVLNISLCVESKALQFLRKSFKY